MTAAGGLMMFRFRYMFMSSCHEFAARRLPHQQQSRMMKSWTAIFKEYLVEDITLPGKLSS